MNRPVSSSRLALTLTATVTLSLGAAAPRAMAQLRAIKTLHEGHRVNPVMPTGHQFHFCPAGVPLEFEVAFENDGSSAVNGVSFTDNVRAGMNGSFLSLLCPATLVPPGVTVTCDTATNIITFDGISVPACGKTLLRFQTTLDGMASMQTVCNSGTYSYAAGSFQTTTPLADQVPPGPATCWVVDSMCGSLGFDVKLNHWIVDENGPPLLPGDTFLVYAAIDLRYAPIPSIVLDHYYENDDGTDTLLPLPPNVDFVAFVSTPLAPTSTYTYDMMNRTVSITGATPLTKGQVNDLVTWRGRLQCAAPLGVAQCTAADIKFMNQAPLGSDDPTTYTDANDAACVTPIAPDFGTSTKTVTDADSSGDAQPGELLTFFVNVANSGQCPAEKMDCECAASVDVVDTVDTAHLDTITPLDGGVFTAPSTVRWTIPRVGAVGRTGSQQAVRFQARAKLTDVAGDLICNTATITSPELKNTADGGISNCPTVPPTTVTLSPCMSVTVPPNSFLNLAKSVTPPLAPPQTAYCPGTTLTFSVTVTNSGAAAATNVSVFDILDANWGGPPYANITPLDGGSVVPAPPPARVAWPVIATLAPGAFQTFRFQATIPLTIAPGSNISNTAQTTSTQQATAISSNTVAIPVDAPAIEFTKTLPPGTYNEGSPITWTITVKNTSAQCPATGLTLTDPIDATKLTTPPTTNPVGTFAANTVTWTQATLAAGATSTFTVGSTIKTGTSGQTVCDTGHLRYDQKTGEILSDPTFGSCTTIGGPTCTPSTLTKILNVLLAAKNQTTRANIDLQWQVLTPAPEYHVNWVSNKVYVDPAKTDPNTPRLSPTGQGSPGCVGATSCTHTGGVSVATSPLFYQVLPACGGATTPGIDEGPY